MTSTSPPPGDPSTVHRRLLAFARERHADFNAVLVQYAIERLLERLSRSSESGSLILKGAMLFRVWTGELLRPTKDVDFLGHGEPSPTAVTDAVRTIISVVVDDGLRFDPDTISAEGIRETQVYDGVRVTVKAYLGHIPITIRIDVGFGDAVTPSAVEHPFPTILEHDEPRIRAYPPETALAEKVEAMCTLGITNSRMKDDFDVIAISRHFAFDGAMLIDALLATFGKRGTPLPSGVPVGLSAEFANDASKQRQWSAFCRRMRSDDVPASLPEVMGMVQKFVLPVLDAAAGARPAPGSWRPAHGWDPPN